MLQGHPLYLPLPLTKDTGSGCVEALPSRRHGVCPAADPAIIRITHQVIMKYEGTGRLTPRVLNLSNRRSLLVSFKPPDNFTPVVKAGAPFTGWASPTTSMSEEQSLFSPSGNLFIMKRVMVKLALEQATKAQTGRRGIALLFP